jgi:hypothetical protein
MGSENRTALIMQFQLFAVASCDGFLGNVREALGYDRLNERYGDFSSSEPYAGPFPTRLRLTIQP